MLLQPITSAWKGRSAKTESEKPKQKTLGRGIKRLRFHQHSLLRIGSDPNWVRGGLHPDILPIYVKHSRSHSHLGAIQSHQWTCGSLNCGRKPENPEETHAEQPQPSARLEPMTCALWGHRGTQCATHLLLSLLVVVVVVVLSVIINAHSVGVHSPLLSWPLHSCSCCGVPESESDSAGLRASLSVSRLKSMTSLCRQTQRHTSNSPSQQTHSRSAVAGKRNVGYCLYNENTAFL